MSFAPSNDNRSGSTGGREESTDKPSTPFKHISLSADHRESIPTTTPQRLTLDCLTVDGLRQTLVEQAPEMPVFFRGWQPCGNIQAVDYTQLTTFELQGEQIPCVVLAAISDDEHLDDYSEIKVDAWGTPLATELVDEEYVRVVPVAAENAAGSLKAGNLNKVLERYEPTLPIIIHNPWAPNDDSPVICAISSEYAFFGKGLPCVTIEPASSPVPGLKTSQV